jgi:hypothetical protein
MRKLSVWDVAGTPEGGVVLSVIGKYSAEGVKPPVLKSLLLIYGKGGDLKSVWDVYPYHHHVAVDAAGDVFALGTKDTKERDYPILVKYSQAGKLLGEYLPASQFALGDAVVESGSANGESQIFAVGSGLRVWQEPPGGAGRDRIVDDHDASSVRYAAAAADSGWYSTARMRSRRRPDGTCHSTVVPALYPSSPVPIGASTEMRFLATSAWPGNTIW